MEKEQARIFFCWNLFVHDSQLSAEFFFIIIILHYSHPLSAYLTESSGRCSYF